MDTALVVAAAKELCEHLNEHLLDPHIALIPLNRDQAVMTLGLLEGLGEIVQAEQGSSLAS